MKAVIVGGSIAGLSCAHAFITAGWDVVVIEKTPTPPTGCSTGAGLALDPLALSLVQTWLKQPGLLDLNTLPLDIEHNTVTDASNKTSRMLARDENLNFRAAYWADLHNLLYKALPADIFLWGHTFVSFSTSEGNHCTVKVKSKMLQTGEITETIGDLLVAADGCNSSIRQSFLRDFKLRYSGYCAWRGVLNFSDKENLETVSGIKKAFPDLGKCIYSDLGDRTHTAFYELTNKHINWIWYVNQPEPQLKGNSVTMSVSNDMIETLHEEAGRNWIPEYVNVIRKTKQPFLNVIYDSEPLDKIVWKNVVLVGDAAHPTTPHGLRSTNMSVVDAVVLGQCLKKYGGVENLNLNAALEEYQSLRVPVTSKQVLFSRKLGQMKQGHVLSDGKRFDPSKGDCAELKQRNMLGSLTFIPRTCKRLQKLGGSFNCSSFEFLL